MRKYEVWSWRKNTDIAVKGLKENMILQLHAITCAYIHQIANSLFSYYYKSDRIYLLGILIMSLHTFSHT